MRILSCLIVWRNDILPSIQASSKFAFTPQRKTLLALEKEEEEERNKTIESLKTALRTQPMRSVHITVVDIINTDHFTFKFDT